MRLADKYISSQVTVALAEDVGEGDLTAALIPRQTLSEAHVVCREQAVLCGAAWFAEVFRTLDSSVDVDWLRRDGDDLQADDVVCRLRGSARALLTGERTALNFLQTLSGTATLASRYTKQIEGTEARILDTRKTVPGLRLAQKYAVRTGGAYNHRVGLYDAILIKENHIQASGSIAAALAKAFDVGPGVEVEIEVENLNQLDEALNAGAKRVLLDNFSLADLRKAVIRNKRQARLEASGGVTIETVRGIAETGVDDISVGSLTKDVRATDFSMRFA